MGRPRSPHAGSKARPWRAAAAALGIACAAALLWSAPAAAADRAGPLKALVRLAADRIDAVFAEVAASTRALGDEYRMLAAHPSPVSDAEVAAWTGRGTTRGSTTGFRTWPDAAPTPAFQAQTPGFYSYRGKTVTRETVARLREFERLLPLFRAAYRSFDFSWVYLTTADEMMLIYPYVPIEQAVNNETPTRQVYYTAADFAHRRVGWTAPYLDLVGAGMMITASYPIYAGDRLLGVASHDITLKQLSRSVLSHLTVGETASAYIVDRHGLAIAASDGRARSGDRPRQRRTEVGRAVLSLARGTRAAAVPGAVASRFGWVDAVTERILDLDAKAGPRAVIDAEIDGRRVLAARIESTGWLVVLVDRKP